MVASKNSHPYNEQIKAAYVKFVPCNNFAPFPREEYLTKSPLFKTIQMSFNLLFLHYRAITYFIQVKWRVEKHIERFSNHNRLQVNLYNSLTGNEVVLEPGNDLGNALP